MNRRRLDGLGLANGQGSRLARGAGAFSFPRYAAHAPAFLGLQAFARGWAAQLIGGLGAGGLVWAISHPAALAGRSHRPGPSPTMEQEAA